MLVKFKNKAKAVLVHGSTKSYKPRVAATSVAKSKLQSRTRAHANVPTVTEGVVLFRKRTYDTDSERFGPWNNLVTISRSSTKKETSVHNFPDGKGQLCIYANLLTPKVQRDIADELAASDDFRQYKIQGSNDEPRSHFLLHEKGTDDFDGTAQPGYRYGHTRMKARPLKSMPKTRQLSSRMETLCKQSGNFGEEVEDDSTFWNIGVNPVMYRDGRDKIGFHADDDQNEVLILSVLVRSPLDATRKLLIRRKTWKENNVRVYQNGEEEFELFLGAGDAYSMDGKYSCTVTGNTVHT